MTPEEIKEQVIRMEGFADGIKQGGNLFAQWIAQKLEMEQASKNLPPVEDKKE